MAHNTRVRTDLAAWGSGAVTQAEFDKLDRNGFVGINGDAGGTWAPSSIISLGGSGLQLNNAPLVISGTGTLSAGGAAFELGAGRFYGAVQFDLTTLFAGASQFNNGFTVTDGAVAFNGMTITTVLGQWTFTNGFVANGDIDMGDGTGTLSLAFSEIYASGDETHAGAETHTGTETHTGSCLFSGDHAVSAGHDITGTEFISGTGARAWDCANTLIISFTVGGSAITMTTPTGRSGVRKFIKCAHNATQDALVVDGTSGQIIANLQPGECVFIASDGTRWY